MNSFQQKTEITTDLRTDNMFVDNRKLMDSACPKWMKDFQLETMLINGSKCPTKLDQAMERYLELFRKELSQNFVRRISPPQAAAVCQRMHKQLVFFYNYFLDIKEFFLMTQFYENMVEMLAIYLQLEMKSSNRIVRGRDTDHFICLRISSLLWVFFAGHEEHMIHTLLKTPNFAKRYKGIFDPIFRKLLVKSKPSRTLTDLEYIRNLLTFKLWKRLFTVQEKKTVTDLALTQLSPPRSFVNNGRKYKFLPLNPPGVDVHSHLTTAYIDLDNAIKEYFAYLENKTSKHFDSDFRTEKRTFISEFCESLSNESTIDNLTDNLTNDLSDVFLLAQIKEEVGTIGEDDDLIIIDPEDTPVTSKPATRTNPTEVIDLTEDEPDCPEINIVPVWCKDLLEQSKQEEERRLLATPEDEIDEVPEEPVVDQEILGDMVVIENQLMECDTPVNVTTVKPIRLNRRNICNTPLNIIDDFTMLEDNSVGLTEITSTSHSVQDQIASEPYEKQITNNYSSSSENVEHVDSTSNINEEYEIPTVIPCVLEQQVENLTLEKNQQQPLQPAQVVGNHVFEKITVKRTTKTTDYSINSLVAPTKTTDISSLVPKTAIDYFDDSDDSLDLDSTPGKLVMDTNHTPDESTPPPPPVVPQEPDDLTSPIMEPISGTDFATYLSHFNTNTYAQLQHKQSPTTCSEFTVNKRVKNGERIVRTYNVKQKLSKHEQPQLEEEPEIDVITTPEPERRVPLNGERVLRFEADVYEPNFINTFKLTAKEFRLCNPVLRLKRVDKKLFGISPEVVAAAPAPIVKMVTETKKSSVNSYEALHSQIVNATGAKTILERRDYVKSEHEKCVRALVDTRPYLDMQPSTSHEKKLPDVVMQTKKRGTELDLTEKYQALNNSFQHHFCADISTCSSSSNCLSTLDCPTTLPEQISYTTAPLAPDSIVYTTPLPPSPPQPADIPELPAYWHSVEPEPMPPPSVLEQPVNLNLTESDQAAIIDQVVANGLLQTEPPDDVTDVHLPIKKRRVSALKVELKDDISYPSTRMKSIAEFENIKTERPVSRTFKTPAELKEVPPLPSSYLISSVPNHVVTDNFNINHTYNNPTINYHVNNLPVINFQYTPHYQIPTLQSIILPVNQTVPNTYMGEALPNYSYIKVPPPVTTNAHPPTINTVKKRRLPEKMKESRKNKSLHSKS